MGIRTKRSWRKKILDSHMGLTFDWRATGLRPWRVLIWSLLIFVAMITFLFMIDVKVPWSQAQSQQAGSVLLLPKDNPTLEHLIARKTPLPTRGPVWADPVMSGLGDQGFCQLVKGLDLRDTPLKDWNTDTFKVVDPVLWSNDVLLEWWGKDLKDISGMQTVCIPVISLCTPELKARITSQGKRDVFSKSTDLTGSKSTFLLSVNEWGVPKEIVLIDSSGNDEADVFARDFVNSLRWAPSSGIKSGTISIEWENKEN